ncbi:MAG: hypothetical protein U1G08_09915 [Verrucomicrobiota bacterium]
MKPSPLSLIFLLAATGLSAFSASIETRLSPSTPSVEAGSDATPEPILGTTSATSPGGRHGISLVEASGSRHHRGNVSLLWYLSNEQIQELEMTGVLDLLQQHINPNYDFHNVTEEQLNQDLLRLQDILSGATGGSAPEPGPTVLAVGGMLTVLWLTRRHRGRSMGSTTNPAA